MIALSASNFLTMAFATRIVMQHATDWKKVTAEVMPIGVADCRALNTYVSMVAVVLKIDPLAP